MILYKCDEITIDWNKNRERFTYFKRVILRYQHSVIIVKNIFGASLNKVTFVQVSHSSNILNFTILPFFFIYLYYQHCIYSAIKVEWDDNWKEMCRSDDKNNEYYALIIIFKNNEKTVCGYTTHSKCTPKAPHTCRPKLSSMLKQNLKMLKQVTDSYGSPKGLTARMDEGHHIVFRHHLVEGNLPLGVDCDVCLDAFELFGSNGWRCSRCLSSIDYIYMHLYWYN